MQNIPGWKIVIKYVVDMLALAVSIAIALFLPEMYARWQDEKINGQVTLAHREQISFLDTTSLDVAGKIKVLTETSEINWTNTLWEYEPAWLSEEELEPEMRIMEQYFGMRPEEMVQKCHALMERWSVEKLFPADCIELVSSDQLSHLAAHMVSADENALTFLVTMYTDGVDGVLLITDLEVEMIYYGCSLGARTMNFMAQEMGYGSLTALASESVSGSSILNAVRSTKPEEFDLTALCGAEAQTVTGAENELEFEADLSYTNFESSARRKVVLGSSGFGLAVWFGTEQMEVFVDQLLMSYGDVLMTTDTMNFLEVCAEDLAGSGIVQTEPAGQVEYDIDSMEKERYWETYDWEAVEQGTYSNTVTGIETELALDGE